LLLPPRPVMQLLMQPLWLG